MPAAREFNPDEFTAPADPRERILARVKANGALGHRPRLADAVACVDANTRLLADLDGTITAMAQVIEGLRNEVAKHQRNVIITHAESALARHTLATIREILAAPVE